MDYKAMMTSVFVFVVIILWATFGSSEVENRKYAALLYHFYAHPHDEDVKDHLVHKMEDGELSIDEYHDLVQRIIDVSGRFDGIPPGVDVTGSKSALMRYLELSAPPGGGSLRSRNP